mmetsp:Transcript_2087/g.3584  ORF Transcript_2087/g.3584 Transcript_2087/m.3584 type:complete len:326 (+) Transcript_2087:39-1016(+)
MNATLSNDEWGEWEMGDDFGFYEDLDNDDEDTSSSSNLFSTPPTYTSDTTCFDSSSCCSSSPGYSTIDDVQPSTLTTYPPILSSTLIDTLSEDGLPWSLQDTNWTRIFCSSRDGTSFGHFMRSVRNVSNTIVVAQTKSGMVVGGFTMDVWSGRKQEEGRMNHSFLFVVDEPASTSTSAAMTNNELPSQKHQQQFQVKRFIPGLEDLASSPTGVLEFNFDSLSLSSDKITKEEQQKMVHIFKPSPRQASLKQVCQLGNKLISLGDDNDDCDKAHHNNTTEMKKKNLLTIEHSFSKGEVTMTSNDGRCITKEFDVVNFEVYCLSEDD